jgi:hypothetical protein
MNKPVSHHGRRSSSAHFTDEANYWRHASFFDDPYFLPHLCYYYPSTCPHCHNYSWWQDMDDDSDPCSCYPSREFDPCEHCYFCDWVFADTLALYDQTPPWVTMRVGNLAIRVYREILLDCNCCFHGVEDARLTKLL